MSNATHQQTPAGLPTRETRADMITAIVLFLLGAAMTYGGFVMDRLEIRQIHPASIPGLVPIILGVALMLCAILLFFSARSRNATAPDDAGATAAGSTANLLIAGAWSAAYALAMVGRLPFGVATAIYIAGFALYFGWPREGDARARLLWTIFSIGFAAVMATGIAILFRDGFLVRLP